MSTPQEEFESPGYLAHNDARLAHLRSLELPWRSDNEVLELGAGIGSHTSYWLSQGAKVTAVEGRPENAALLRVRYPNTQVIVADLRTWTPPGRYGCVYAYGILYHLPQPAAAISRWASAADNCLLLETCVAPGWPLNVQDFREGLSPSAALDGCGCRPTRTWLFAELSKYFKYVYMPLTQPRHDDFPLDWSGQKPFPSELQRAIYCCFHTELENPWQFIEGIPMFQRRH